MSEKYNIPEQNFLDSMEGLETIDDFNSEEFVLDESNGNQEQQNVEELLYDLIYNGKEPGNDDSVEKILEHRKDYVKKIRKGMKEMIQEWHDLIKPKYVILTETAGTPFGYVFKEMWRTAYPDEELPRFYRIDPRFIESYVSWREKSETLSDYIDKRIEDKDANLIFFDESIATGKGLKVLENRFSTVNHYGVKNANIFSYWGFGSKGEKNLGGGMIRGDGSEPQQHAGYPIHPVPNKWRITEKVERSPGPFIREDEEKPTITSKIKKGPERKVALENIKKLKKIGVILGQEMKEETELK